MKSMSFMKIAMITKINQFVAKPANQLRPVQLAEFACRFEFHLVRNDITVCVSANVCELLIFISTVYGYDARHYALAKVVPYKNLYTLYINCKNDEKLPTSSCCLIAKTTSRPSQFIIYMLYSQKP